MQKTLTDNGATRTKTGRLHTFAGIALLLLATQFLIGMVVNLYVQVPSTHPGAGASEYFSGVVQGVIWAMTHSTLALLVHTVLGLLLVLASFVLIGLAIASRHRLWIVLSILGWIGVCGAGFNGASYLNYGHDFSSLLMSVGFLLATVCYTLVFSLRR